MRAPPNMNAVLTKMDLPTLLDGRGPRGTNSVNYFLVGMNMNSTHAECLMVQ